MREFLFNIALCGPCKGKFCKRTQKEDFPDKWSCFIISLYISMATLITFWEVSLFFFFIDIEINILQQQCEHIEILRHIIIILCVSIVVVFMPHIQFFLSLSSPLMNKFMFRRLKTREWVQSGGRDKFSYIWRGGNFFGRGRKRHSALTIRNYQKMYIYVRQGRCVCVPFIISMWLIEIRIRKWKQWTWIFQFRSFLCSYENIFVTNGNNFYVSHCEKALFDIRKWINVREEWAWGQLISHKKGCECTLEITKWLSFQPDPYFTLAHSHNSR